MNLLRKCVYSRQKTVSAKSWLENLWHVWNLIFELLGFFPADQLVIKGFKGIITI